jgi:hypothetical protein
MIFINEHHIGWSIEQLKTLLSTALNLKSSTIISYAALEARITIERIEFELLVMAAHKSLNLEWADLIETYKGIQRVNAKYNSLKYRYQTFTAAFSNALSVDLPLKPFQYKKSEEFLSRLAQYIHIYSTKPDDLQFESIYMQSGINLIKEFIAFLENMFPIVDGSYIYGIIDFSTLKHGMDVEFQNWLKETDENIEALTDRLRIIMNNYQQQ